jgi:hypothetical protein
MLETKRGGAMKYNAFIETLQNNPDLELTFEFEGGQIRDDYHITEVMSTTVSAMDCGQRLERWNESVIQLFEPSKESQMRSMNVKKALGIFKKSSDVIAIPGDANVVLEFKPRGAAAAQRYQVASVISENGKLLIQSEGATTQCKPAVKSGSGCC